MTREIISKRQARALAKGAGLSDATIEAFVREMSDDANHVVESYVSVGSDSFTVRRVPVDYRQATADPEPGVGWVYFIQADRMVKIGFSRDYTDRMRSLQTASPIRLRLLLAIHGTERQEKELHAKFSPLRKSGEWFELKGALLDYLEKFYLEQRETRRVLL